MIECQNALGGGTEQDRELALAGLNYAYALTHDLHDAEDLAQEAAMRIFRKKGRLSNKPYFFAAIRNLYCNLCKRRRTVAFVSLVDESAVISQSSSRPDQRLDIDSMLGRLSDAQREVLYLHYIEGFSAAEIASTMSRPRATVLSQLARAREKLRNLFPDNSLKEDVGRERRFV